MDNFLSRVCMLNRDMLYKSAIQKDRDSLPVQLSKDMLPGQ